MKKTVFILLFILMSGSVYAADGGDAKKKPYQSWFSVGYAYNFPGDSDYSSLGPITVSIGRTFWKFLAVELDVSYIDYSTSKRKYIVETNVGGVAVPSETFGKGDIHAVVIRPYFLIRPEFQLLSTNLSLTPYIGVGGVGFILAEPASKKGDGTVVNFDGGLAAKIGLAFSYRRFLVSVESEYLMTTRKPVLSNGFTLGANVGIRF